MDMLNFIIGGLVALYVLGLPLAIIALFVAGSLEKSPTAVSERNRLAIDVAPDSDRLADERRYRRQRIVYGNRSAMAARLLSREPVHFHSTSV
jgi:hypothetical protein